MKLILIALIIQVPLTGERRTRVAENKEIAKAEDEKEEVLSHTQQENLTVTLGFLSFYVISYNFCNILLYCDHS